MSTPPPAPPPTRFSSPPAQHPLADIFSDSPPGTPFSALPSDMPRLRATHATAGYRSGISAAKTAALQPGFDEGYSLGAVLGLRVGYVLGVLEGLWGAVAKVALMAREGEVVQDEVGIWVEEEIRLGKVRAEAKAELAVENVYGKEWWGQDGVWRFAVEGEEVTFENVAERHPLLEKWSLRVRDEMRRFEVQEGRFEGEEWESGRVGDNEGGDPAARDDSGSSPRTVDVGMGASSDSR